VRRADRLFQIVQMLRGGRLSTAARLATHLEVSERTIYRDIADLQANGVPIEGEAGVGYVLRPGYHLPPLMFTRDELTALLVGARLASAWGGGRLALAAEGAIAKIEGVLPDRLRDEVRETRVYALDYRLAPETKAHIDVLNDAITRRNFIGFAYQKLDGARSTRRVRPLGLFFWGGVWTLAAYCEMRRAHRTFRVDRMTEVEVEKEPTDVVAVVVVAVLVAVMVVAVEAVVVVEAVMARVVEGGADFLALTACFSF